MNKIRPIILAVVAALAGYLAYGVLPLPTLPASDVLNISKTGYTIVNVVIFAVFLILFAIEGVRGRVKAPKVLAKSAAVLGFAAATLIAGELIALVCGTIAEVPFKLFGSMPGVGFADIVTLASIAFMLLLAVAVYISKRAKAVRAASGSMRASGSKNAVKNHAFNALYGSLAFVFFLSVVMLIAQGKNMMLLIPLVFATIAMILYHLTNLRGGLVVAIGLILVHALSFCYALSMTYTIGALGVVMTLAFLSIIDRKSVV